MLQRSPLSNREIAVLLHMLAHAGLSGRMSLPPQRRVHVTRLWRRYLVEVWYRCAPDEGCSHGPYFNLTADGYQLACALQSAREQRRNSAQHPLPQIAA